MMGFLVDYFHVAVSHIAASISGQKLLIKVTAKNKHFRPME